MPMVSLRQLLDDAAERGYAVPAFNINDMEQMAAVMGAARRTGSPVIIQASKGARAYAGDKVLKHLMLAAAETYPDLPICLHQDHGTTPEVCRSAIENGFTSVMMDGSLTPEGRPSTYEYNVKVTREVAILAHGTGVSVEGEIGVIGSLEKGGGEKEDGVGLTGAADRKKLLTDPVEAEKFVAATGIDALAVAIGTSHGAYKFSRRPDGEILSIETIRLIHARIPDTPLVMHGSS
ncbi:MAG: ketose-bisphosphate aldolase, partial [Rickettsiales bacterium]|nr:ketose-bisphosphate aldolase [Rickettsiales bacterium]